MSMDRNLAGGFGPKPSRAEIALRSVCAPSCSHRTARWAIDPLVRCCLCSEFDDYGHRIWNPPEICWKGRLFLGSFVFLSGILDFASSVMNIWLAYALHEYGEMNYGAILYVLIVDNLWMNCAWQKLYIDALRL